MGMISWMIVVIIISILLGGVGYYFFNKNEIKVKTTKQEIEDFKTNNPDSDVPESLTKKLKRETDISILFYKVEIVGITTSITMFILIIIKLLLNY